MRLRLSKGHLRVPFFMVRAVMRGTTPPATLDDMVRTRLLQVVASGRSSTTPKIVQNAAGDMPVVAYFAMDSVIRSSL